MNNVHAAADEYFHALRVYAQSPEYKARLQRPGAVDSRELVELLRRKGATAGSVRSSSAGGRNDPNRRRAVKYSSIVNPEKEYSYGLN